MITCFLSHPAGNPLTVELTGADRFRFPIKKIKSGWDNNCLSDDCVLSYLIVFYALYLFSYQK